MKHTAVKLLVVAVAAVAVPVTAIGPTLPTADMKSSTSATVEDGTVLKEKRSTGTVSVVASNLPLARIVSQLEHQSGVPISLRGTAAELKVTVIAPRGQTVHEVLKQVVDANPELLLKQATFNTNGQETAGYEIWENGDYEKAAAVVEIYQLKEADATNLEKFIRPILTQNTGTILADKRLNKLIIHDIPEKQAVAGKLIAELDTKLPTKVFSLRHREANDVARHVQQFFSLSLEQLVADNESGQIAVKGSSETITRVEQLIEAFDVPPMAKRDKVTTSP